jgi:molybdopterin synthase catalytic subunit
MSKMKSIDIQIKSSALSLEEQLAFVSDEASGGINVFVGNVRNQTKDKPVIKLEFESYIPMAIKEMELIATEALSRYEINKISIQHRIGTLLPGETAVIIVVGSAHRDDAFRACRYCIDTLKKTVPIWKKEFFEDGAVWVAAHP